jgi:TolB-like protein/class 3 adenylate cyclase/Flp pilus assembly protein TadD
MDSETRAPAELAIAHVLFIDIVGYTKLAVNRQTELLQLLNDIVRETPQFRAAEAADKLVRLPTGDGMALAFFTSPDAPVRCAMEIGRRLKELPQLNVRMGVHSGPVDVVHDVNDRTNITGAGINMAQRVMDCGDAGHILLSKRVADDLGQYEHWQPQLYDLGECEVKHGATIEVVNFFDGEAGSPELPEKFKRKHEAHALESRAAVLRRRRRFLLASLGVLLLGLIIAGVVTRWRSKPVAEHKTIAILPFKPLVATASDPVLEVGMADTLITKLSGKGGIIVTSLTSAQAFAGSDPVTAGRKLGVNSVLDGSVERASDRLRVTVRLIKVADGSSPWSATYNEKFTDVFTVQDTISKKVAEALELRLNPEEQKRLTTRYTDNLEAYQLYLTGRFHWSKLIPPEIDKSIGFFEQAIKQDPDYTLAYFGLGEAYRARSMAGDLRPVATFPRATAAARKAIELDPALAEPHITLAVIYGWFDWDFSGSEREARRALQLNPSLALAHSVLTMSLVATGRFAEAMAEAKKSQQLDPVSPFIAALAGSTFFDAGHDEEAVELLNHALELNPDFWLAHHFLGQIFTKQKNYAEAIAQLNIAVEASHGNSDAVSMRAYVWAITGERAKAQAVLEQLKSAAEQRYIPPWSFSVIYLGLGDLDQAFAWLEKGCEERDPHVTFIVADPKWDVVRGDPRFVTALRRIGFKKD